NIRTGIAGYASDAEATQLQYDAIEALAGNVWETSDPGNDQQGDNAVFWAQFYVAENPADIVELQVNLWGAQDDNTDKAWLGIWNVAEGEWTFLSAFQQEDTDGVDLYTGTITVDPDEYLDGSGNVTVIFFNEDVGESLFV